jgi:molybdopterin/thiamine biosynthesis adenylyltransferase
MLESAYNLLNIENPLGSDQGDKMISAPSRHRLLVGQEVRADAHRLYVGTALASYLAALPPQACGTIEFSLHFASTALRARALIHEVTPTGAAQSWSDTTIPKSLRGRDDSRIEEGFFFSTDLSTETIGGISDVQGLQGLLARLGHNPELLGPNDSVRQQIIGVAKQPAGVLLIDCIHTPHFFFLLDSGSVIELKAVLADSRAQDSRIPEIYKALSGKSVGIVGAGSVGSKIALTLARMGVLDWNSIAEQKADALKEALLRIHSEIKVEVSRIHLTGQESAAVVSSALNRLGQCDLIIDATADARVFNLLAATAKAEKKPLVWMEVFAGGLGGMIARSRPGSDPDPHTMRAVYAQYCIEHPAPEIAVATDYTTENAEGQVLTASDTDVAIIAHHAARLAVDTLVHTERTTYPYSMYIIGLEQWWVFDAPLHTIPIATEEFRRAEPEFEEVWKDESDNIQFLRNLIKKETDATPSSA